MARDKSTGLRVLAMLALAALPELACCHLAAQPQAPVVLCGAEGPLPDPTDCRNYMECTRNSDGSYTQIITPCPGGTYYDWCQGNCSLTQQPDYCPVTCSKDGTILSTPVNLYLTFACTINDTGSYLNVSKCDSCSVDTSACPVNNASPGTSGSCTDTSFYGDEKNCSVYYYCSNKGASPVLGSCGSDQYFITYNHTCVEFHCPSEGRFADPANCSRYYYCDRQASDYVKTHIECPSGSHFDRSVGGCMMGTCTTVCPGVSGGSGGSGGSETFSCPSSGIFADPLSCSSYYYCNNNLEATRITCPSGSHFDSTAGGCLLGSCSSRMV